MWLLSCEGDLLDGKKLWLRPGSAHLLGRTSSSHDAENDARVRYIDHGSVSRKHLVLSVAPVQPGDSSRLLARSVITAIDGSRSGSTINGVPLKKDSRPLEDKDRYIIQLGNLGTRFILEWRPVVLSFNVGKAAKAKGTALKEEKAKLEGADIKLTPEYLSDTTTHVVAKKRNVATGLQALLQAKWLVTDSFVNALADKCKRRGGNGANDPGCSPLEDDFEANWPNEMDFVVPAAGEPVKRPNEYLKPDPDRADLFSNHTFLFLSQDQLDLLLPVITAGGGKAVAFDFVAGETTVNDVVDFVKQLVGKKHPGRLLLSQESGPGGVVIVRLSEKAGGRSDDFLSELSVALDQRTIEQSELLDAILTKDVKSFRHPLRDKTQSAPGTQMENTSSSIPQPPDTSQAAPRSSRERNSVTISDSPPAASQRSRAARQPQRSQPQTEASQTQPTRQPYRRTATARTNVTFNDEFDPSQAVPDDSSDEDVEPSRARNTQAMDVDEPSQQQVPVTQTNSRKRPAPDTPEVDEQDAAQKRDERLMPALQKAKRQRTEIEAKKARAAVDPTPEPERANTATEKTQDSNKEEAVNAKGKPVKRRAKQVSETGLDLRDKMKANRVAADEEWREEEEELQQDDYDVNSHVPQVAEFVVPIRPREEAPSQTQIAQDRPEWRGRQNHKAFRSNKNKANNRPEELETQPVIIGLKPVPGKDHGLGDDYWLHKGRKKGSQSQSQSQHRQSGSALATANGTVQLDDAEDEDDELAFRRRLDRSREEDEANVEMENFQSRTTRPSGQKKLNGKRPATNEALNTPAAKRPRPTGRRAFFNQDDDDDSEDDPLAFKRKRR